MVAIGIGMLVGSLWRLLPEEQKSEAFGSPQVWAALTVLLVGLLTPLGPKIYDLLK